ncbi:MAG: DoxX family protein [Niabella sp.]
MKTLTNFCRVLVGVLFIFSGLVKANDPIGLSYKMQEFFDLWGTTFLNNFSLIFAVLMIAFEIIAGVALLVGWKTKLMSWLLLLLIVFFTFLTGYAYLSGKFSSCGCFGDCIPIKSGQSFAKDVVLLVLIVFLFFNQKYITPIFKPALIKTVMVLVVLFSFASQWYTLKYLPVVDCSAFRVGNNIPEKMTMPKNAVPDSTVITFVYEKDGKRVEFSSDEFPDDFNEDTYKFVDRYDKVVREGANNVPPIKTFVLLDAAGVDNAAKVLSDKHALILFMEDAATPLDDWRKSFSELYKRAVEKNIPVYVVTSRRTDIDKAFAGAPFKDAPIFEADRTMIRTASRANPTVYYLKDGTIAGKWSSKHFDRARQKVEEAKDVLPPQTAPVLPPLDSTLHTGDSIHITV